MRAPCELRHSAEIGRCRLDDCVPGRGADDECCRFSRWRCRSRRRASRRRSNSSSLRRHGPGIAIRSIHRARPGRRPNGAISTTSQTSTFRRRRNAAPGFHLPIQGDAERGRALAYDRSRGGSCVVCHIMGKTTPAQPGNVGPDLSTIGATRDDQFLFNYVYDPRIYNANSIMPPWGAYQVYRLDEVRDIVAFLKTLKEPYAIADKNENPNTRAAPVESRDNLDLDREPGDIRPGPGTRSFQAQRRQWQILRVVSCGARDGVQNVGRANAALRAALAPCAGRRGIHHAPCARDHRRQPAHAEQREHRTVDLPA